MVARRAFGQMFRDSSKFVLVDAHTGVAGCALAPVVGEFVVADMLTAAQTAILSPKAAAPVAAGRVKRYYTV